MADVEETQLELNPALEDIKEIHVNRPELTEEQWQTVNAASNWIKATLRPEVRMELELEYTKKQAAFEDTLRTETQKMVSEQMEAWRKEQKPLDKTELSTLLSQDYIEFRLKLKIKGEDALRDFTIAELPGTVETRFIKEAQKSLLPMIEQINSSEWKLTGSVLAQLEALLANCPLAVQVAGDLVAICLDPWSEHSEITGAWVLANISIKRIWDILVAQSEANRYRDFLSNGSRLFRSLKTM